MQQSDKSLRTILETANEGFWQIDQDARTVDINPRLCAILGRTPEEIMGRKVQDFLHDHSRAEFEKQFLQWKKGEATAYEATFLQPDGTPVHCLVKGTPLFDEDQVITGSSAMVTDITEGIEAAKALAESREKFRKFVQSSPMGIFIYKLEEDGRLVFMDANPVASRILGLDCLPFVGMTIEEAFPPLAETEVPHAYRRVCITGEPWFSEQVDYEDAKIRGAYEVHAFRTEPGMMAVLFLDITDRKRTEEELRQREAVLQSMFRTVPTGICMVSDHRLIHVNQRICEMTGYSAQELLNRRTRLFYSSEEMYESVLRNIYRQIDLHGTGTVETQWIRKDGSAIDVLSSSTPIDPADHSAGVIFSILDITERNRAERERERLEMELSRSRRLEAVGQLTGGIAHDFNNILTAVLGNVDLALGALGMNDPGGDLSHALHEIKRSAGRASSLTHQLLAFSRKQVLKPEILDLNRTVEDMETMLHRLISESIRLEIILSPELKSIHADPGQVEQVIMNLVVNARDAMPEGGTVTIKTAHADLDEDYVILHAEARQGPHVVLSIHDTGCGMAFETQERIFEPFFTTKPPGMGTGLGLSTVYGIVKQAGGHITVNSKPEEHTIFRVYFPAVDQPAEAPRKKESESREEFAGTETLYLCEDDRAVRKLTAQMLKESGYTVISAGSGEEALELCGRRTEPIDLLIADVIMPDMNGRKLARQLNEKWPELKTLFISGYSSDVISRHGVLDEGVEFLGKPFNRMELLRKVREILDHP